MKEIYEFMGRMADALGKTELPLRMDITSSDRCCQVRIHVNCGIHHTTEVITHKAIVQGLNVCYTADYLADHIIHRMREKLKPKYSICGGHFSSVICDDIFDERTDYVERASVYAWIMQERAFMAKNPLNIKLKVEPKVKDPADELMSWLEDKIREHRQAALKSMPLFFDPVYVPVVEEHIRIMMIYADVQRKVVNLKTAHKEGHENVLKQRKQLGKEISDLIQMKHRYEDTIKELAEEQKRVRFTLNCDTSYRDELRVENANLIHQKVLRLKELNDIQDLKDRMRHSIGGGKTRALLDENKRLVLRTVDKHFAEFHMEFDKQKAHVDTHIHDYFLALKDDTLDELIAKNDELRKGLRK